MMMNIKLLRQIQQEMLAHPTQVDMDRYFNTLPVFKTIKGCGTAGCIAGWSMFLSAKGTLKTLASVGLIKSNFGPYKAQKQLQLTVWQRDRLFYISGWPKSFIKRLNLAKSPKSYAKVVAERIEHFIKTKGAE